MIKLKTPHIIKVYEALGALGGGRVAIDARLHARVHSSDESKAYDVQWTDDWTAAVSNDNATFWQKQLGYPIIAAMFATGHIPYDTWAASTLANVPWKQLNDQWKRKYDQVIEFVLSDLGLADVDRTRLRAEASRLHQVISESPVALLSSERSPEPNS